VETPQTVLGSDGTVPVAGMIHAAAGRVSGLHFGTYDYTASLGVLGAHQNLRHPVADFAKNLMMLAAAETGVRVSDGSDNKVPIGDAKTVGRRWTAHAEGVTRALRQGIFQGWDLHPAQLPTRFAATFAFFRDGWTEAATRLADYHRQVPGAGGVLDEPATAFALARHLAAALACGAIRSDELERVAGIHPAVVDRYLVRGAPPGVKL
jgi:citrate lyase beta subunit